MHEGDATSERDEALAANRALDASIRALAEAKRFVPTKGPVVLADEDGHVVWLRVEG